MADREGERERRSCSYLARDPDSTPVQLDELAGQGQAEPRALDLLVRRPHLRPVSESGTLYHGDGSHDGRPPPEGASVGYPPCMP